MAIIFSCFHILGHLFCNKHVWSIQWVVLLADQHIWQAEGWFCLAPLPLYRPVLLNVFAFPTLWCVFGRAGKGLPVATWGCGLSRSGTFILPAKKLETLFSPYRQPWIIWLIKRRDRFIRSEILVLLDTTLPGWLLLTSDQPFCLVDHPSSS